jgi:hypothetical protein
VGQGQNRAHPAFARVLDGSEGPAENSLIQGCIRQIMIAWVMGIAMVEWLKLGVVSLLLSILLTAVIVGPVLLLAG